MRECIDPHKVIYGKRELFVDLDIVLHSCVEWLEFPYGPVRPGDTIMVSNNSIFTATLEEISLIALPLQTRAFVHYTLNDQNRIIHVSEMYWPAGYLNKPIKRLGGSDTQRAALDALVAGFNAGRFEAIGDYYTEDAVVEFLPNERLVGRAEIVKNFKSIREKAKVKLEVKNVICDDNGICLTIRETFQALVDDSNFQIMPLKVGEESSRLIIIVVSLTGGLISSSRSIAVD